jgi:hypothetical protein
MAILGVGQPLIETRKNEKLSAFLPFKYTITNLDLVINIRF